MCWTFNQAKNQKQKITSLKNTAQQVHIVSAYLGRL